MPAPRGVSAPGGMPAPGGCLFFRGVPAPGVGWRPSKTITATGGTLTPLIFSNVYLSYAQLDVTMTFLYILFKFY